MCFTCLLLHTFREPYIDVLCAHTRQRCTAYPPLCCAVFCDGLWRQDERDEATAGVGGLEGNPGVTQADLDEAITFFLEKQKTMWVPENSSLRTVSPRVSF